VCGCWAYGISLRCAADCVATRSKISSPCSMTDRGDVDDTCSGHLVHRDYIQRRTWPSSLTRPRRRRVRHSFCGGDAVGMKHRSVRPSGRTRPRPATHMGTMGTETAREVTCGDNGSNREHRKYYLRFLLYLCEFPCILRFTHSGCSGSPNLRSREWRS
jgi:hypothetical protein